jgi:hypothetical protein
VHIMGSMCVQNLCAFSIWLGAGCGDSRRLFSVRDSQCSGKQIYYNT